MRDVLYEYIRNDTVPYMKNRKYFDLFIIKIIT